MTTRRDCCKMLATAVMNLADSVPALAAASEEQLRIKPYLWEGPYARMREAHGAQHDWRLCADLRAPWMAKDERLIVRSSEIVGYQTGFFYDDHLPASEPEGRGKAYRHTPFEWKSDGHERVLTAACAVPGKGKFSLALTAQTDYLDIQLGVRNGLGKPTGEIDWAFCVVGMESPSFSDSERRRTFLYDGTRLRSFAELRKTLKIELFRVHQGGGFIPAGHKTLAVNPLEAKAAVVIVESPDRQHVAALGFERAYTIYGDAKGNKCFHADPYFGPLAAGEERAIKGRLYLMKGTAQDAFARFTREFPSGV